MITVVNFSLTYNFVLVTGREDIIKVLGDEYTVDNVDMQLDQQATIVAQAFSLVKRAIEAAGNNVYNIDTVVLPEAPIADAIMDIFERIGYRPHVLRMSPALELVRGGHACSAHSTKRTYPECGTCAYSLGLWRVTPGDDSVRPCNECHRLHRQGFEEFVPGLRLRRS